MELCGKTLALVAPIRLALPVFAGLASVAAKFNRHTVSQRRTGSNPRSPLLDCLRGLFHVEH
jgi:hypothetical protein